MASILKVDEMQGVTSAGDITITSEGGSATQSLQQGLTKAWVNFDGNSSGVQIDDSFNVASTTDNGTGNYSFAFSNAMSNGLYCVSGVGGAGTGSSVMALSIFSGTDLSTTSVPVLTKVASPTDTDPVCVNVNGDLA